VRILHLLPFLFACVSRQAAPTESAAPTASDPHAEIETWIAQGRALLEAGSPVEAEAVFARAAAQEGDSLRTHMWLLRSWMDQDRSDETLAALDALETSGEQGIELKYLYGMAFARRAESAVASGSWDGSVQMLFLDAVPMLRDALEADATLFGDALLPLARCAWYVEELPTARSAADQAVARRPESAPAWVVRGRIALSQFVVAENQNAGSSEAEALWTDTTHSLRRALQLYGAPEGPGAAAGELAGAATELAHALLWRQRFAEATEAFSTAIAWAPEAVDYAAMQRLLAPAKPAQGEAAVGFAAALETGVARFAARPAAAYERAATPLWWLGWERFTAADWSASEEAFLACMKLEPSITNAWFYVGLARQYRKDHDGAIAALHSGWEADPTTMTATAQSAGGSLRAFEALIGWCASQEPARNLEAAFLAELLAQAFPADPRHWNNLGLFLRDEGERLEIAAHLAHEAPPDPALLSDLYERSFTAYQRALALTPDDPQVLNDTALMLQYHLLRDLDQVEAMYRRSIALSEERLASPDISAEDRARFEQTKSDASGNLRRLLEPEAEEVRATRAQASVFAAAEQQP